MASLKSRIRGGESAVLEFKSTAPVAEKLARVVGSFANSAGGDICVGVDDAGRIVGVEDVAAEKRAVLAAAHLVEPQPELTFDEYTHELKDVLVVHVDEIEYPDHCEVVMGKERVAYFRVGKETRPVTNEVVKLMIRLRRHARGDRDLTPEGKRLVDWLWEKGEAPEAACARKLNYSSHRLRKLAESLIGGGYVLPCRMGQGRTYVAIRPGLGRVRKR